MKSGDGVSKEVLDLACGDSNERSLNIVPSISRLIERVFSSGGVCGGAYLAVSPGVA